MLRGEKVALRARIEADVPVLHAELYDDVVTWSRSDGRPWRPLSAGSDASPYAVTDPTDNMVSFSVVELVEGQPLAGDAALWGINTNNRSAHVGIGLRPAFRRRGLGEDAVRVLCEYAFALRGLHRVGLETLEDNFAMIRVAERVGFVKEGTARQAAWVNGEYLDRVDYGMLEGEWHELEGGRRRFAAAEAPTAQPAVTAAAAAEEPGKKAESAPAEETSEKGDGPELSWIDDIVDEAGRESFPASDPPAF